MSSNVTALWKKLQDKGKLILYDRHWSKRRRIQYSPIESFRLFAVHSKTNNFDKKEYQFGKAFQDQQRLCYENMFCGVVTKYFGDVQDEYHKQIEAKEARLNRQKWFVILYAHYLSSVLKYGKHNANMCMKAKK